MEAKKARGDIILYSVLFIASFIFYKWIIPTQIYMNALAKMEKFNPDTFPHFATIIFMVASAAGLIWAVIRYFRAVRAEGRPVHENAENTRKEKIGMFMPFFVFALVVVYIILFAKIGFIIASVIVPPVILFIIGCRKPKFFAIYYIFVAVMYLLFRFVLSVPIR